MGQNVQFYAPNDINTHLMIRNQDRLLRQVQPNDPASLIVYDHLVDLILGETTEAIALERDYQSAWGKELGDQHFGEEQKSDGLR